MNSGASLRTDLLATVSDAIQAVRPPLPIVDATETGSFDDAVVEMADGYVLWRIIRERSVLALVAAPDFDRSVWYDSDLLMRLLREETMRPAAIPPSIDLLMTGHSLQDLIHDLEELRSAVGVAFVESTWTATRQRLQDLRRRRDEELFGRRGSGE